MVGLWGESGLIEITQVCAWLASAFIAWAVAFTARDAERPALLFALGVLAILAAAREIDLHIHLNPETLGPYGVRYRIDWLLNGEVPIWLRGAWLAIFTLVACILFLVFRRAGPQFKRMFAARTLTALLLVGTFGFILIGYTLDDLMRGIFSGQRGLFEESVELLAALLYLSAVLNLAIGKDRPAEA